jgi:multidrug transporter EmrE-like cation transporter
MLYIYVLLGMFINKEKIRAHQKIGLVLAIICAVGLAASM